MFRGRFPPIKRSRVTFTANGKRQTANGKQQTANVNLQHVTKFSLNLCFTVHYFYPQICSFRLVLSLKIDLDCFQLHVPVLRNSQLESDVCRLPILRAVVSPSRTLRNVRPGETTARRIPFAANVNLTLSNASMIISEL